MKLLFDLWVDDNADENFIRFLRHAINTRARVRIVYSPEWEDFSGYHGGDGRHHSIYIGQSTGPKKIPLSICRRDSMGGPALLTNPEAIESYSVK